MQYIALLRGINVGGKRPVKMSVLKTAYEAAGFTNVQTYINSGNVLFEAPETGLTTLAATCDQIMVETFGFSVNIAVVTADQLIQAVADAPTWWGNMPDVKHNLIVAIAPKTGVELSAPVKTFGRTRWSTVAKGDLYQWLTIRNANTARKLVALAQALREA